MAGVMLFSGPSTKLLTFESVAFVRNEIMGIPRDRQKKSGRNRIFLLTFF